MRGLLLAHGRLWLTKTVAGTFTYGALGTAGAADRISVACQGDKDPGVWPLGISLMHRSILGLSAECSRGALLCLKGVPHRQVPLAKDLESESEARVHVTGRVVLPWPCRSLGGDR